jgi:hypothetical protein
MPNKVVATFASTHLALRAEKVSKAAGLAFRMVPVPRSLSTDCHMGLQVAAKDGKILAELLQSKGIEAVLHEHSPRLRD